MKPSSKRLIGVGLSLVFLIGTAFVLSVFILPTTETIQRLRGEEAALGELYDRELARVETVKQVFEQFGGISNLQDTLSLALPIEENVPSIINQVNGIAKISGIVINSIDLQLLPIRSTSQESAIRPVGTVRIVLDVQGAYESIKLYLQAIETNVRIMDVQKLNVEGGADESQVLNYKIVIHAYYQN